MATASVEYKPSAGFHAPARNATAQANLVARRSPAASRRA